WASSPTGARTSTAPILSFSSPKKPSAMEARNSEPCVSAVWRTSVPVSISASLLDSAFLVRFEFLETAERSALCGCFSLTLPPFIAVESAVVPVLVAMWCLLQRVGEEPRPGSGVAPSRPVTLWLYGSRSALSRRFQWPRWPRVALAERGQGFVRRGQRSCEV